MDICKELRERKAEAFKKLQEHELDPLNMKVTAKEQYDATTKKLTYEYQYWSEELQKCLDE